MKYLFSILLMLAFGNAFPQSDNYKNIFKYDAAKTSDRSREFFNYVDDAVIMNFNADDYSKIFEKRSREISIVLPVSASQKMEVNLERFEVLSPDARIVERTAKGEKDVDLRNVTLSYKGNIKGVPNSFATVSFYNGRLMGLISNDKETFVIGPLGREDAVTGEYIFYKESNLKNRSHLPCGSEAFQVPQEVMDRIKKFDGRQVDYGTANLLDAKIAIDVDYFTYGVYGNSVPNTTAYALALMASSSAVYAKEVNVKLTVGYLRVWTIQDPYTSNDGSTLLDQFRFEWIANQGGVERVVAHLISRRTSISVGGIAFLNALCNPTYGYGLSAVLGTINNLPAYSYDVEVVTHELGHNFGSQHTHWCGWNGGPIDTCYFTEGGCYNGPLHPAVGTIMSYCDTEGGSVILTFGPQPAAVIRNGAENASCIPVSARPLFAAYPNGGETFRTQTQSIIYWGTSLTGNVNIELSTNNGSSWTSIQNNVPAQNRQAVWTVPYIGYTNQARLRILDSSNPTVGDTSDAAFRIILTYVSFNVVSPPNLTRIETSRNGTSLHKFVWNNAGGHPSLRYGFKIRKLGTSGPDYFFASDNSGIDTAITFRNSFLDTLAQTIGTVGDSVRCSWRGWAYNGYDSAQSSNSFILTLKRTNVGISILSTVVPDKFNLENNYPNPFNPQTVIKFDVAKMQNVKIVIYDAVGREVNQLVNERLQPGKYSATFEAANFASGIYYYKMIAGDFIQTKKMLLIK